jgi:adenylate kinase
MFLKFDRNFLLRQCLGSAAGRKNMKFKTLLFTIMLFVVNFSYFQDSQAVGQSQTIISFMGAPGSGKGTLAGKCIKELKYTSFSVGNLLREEIAKGTPLGKKVECIKEGKFISDKLVGEIVAAWLTENLPKTDTLVLDGFPRTVRQAKLFLDFMHTKFNNVSFRVVDLLVADETVVQRIADRLVCEKCQTPESRALLDNSTKLTCGMCSGNLIKREDDKEEVVRERLKIYAEHAKLLLDVYKKADVKIDSICVVRKTPRQVFDELKKRLVIETSLAVPVN